MCLAIDQAALQSCQGDKPPGRDASDQYRYRPRQGRLYPLLLIVVVVTATPPPIAAATTATAQELGVRAEGGIFILFFLFAYLVIGEVTPHQLSHHYRHDSRCIEFLRELGRGKR
jgi:hypothetical protein